MKPPKILPCPSCLSSTGPGILEGLPIPRSGRFVSRNHHFRVGCPCGTSGPWAVTVRRAIEVWNDRSL